MKLKIATLLFLVLICPTLLNCQYYNWNRGFSFSHRSSGRGWGQQAPRRRFSVATSPLLMENPIVQIRDGGLRGFTMRSSTGKQLEAFLGIPFAMPPVGPLRFQDPIRNQRWNGVRDAIAQAPQCIQVDFYHQLSVHGQEDCLYLNVYRPKQQSSKKLPVMVWLHGGGYFFGAGSIYGPSYLLEHDIIFITINYRLGPFGYLSTGDAASPGNQGMKDQVLALKWIQQNIEAFGGDANSVTIFGQSAGGSSAQLHIVSPLSRGLFHRAISQSSTALCYWAVDENPMPVTTAVANHFNCTGNSYEIVSCLRNVNATQLAPIQLTIAQWHVFPIVRFAPVIEHNHPGAFLKERPQETYKKGNAMKVPFISGFTRDELAWLTAGLSQDPNFVNGINNEWDRTGPILLDIQRNTTEINREIVRNIWNYYMGNDTLSFDTREKFSALFTDRFVGERGLEALRYHKLYTEADTYAYRLTYQGNYSVVQASGQNPRDWGVLHFDDTIYLMNNTDYYTTLTPEMEEFQMSRIMTGVWTNFAKFGKPLVPVGNTIRDVWQPLENIRDVLSPIKFLELNLNPKMVNDPYEARYKFWRELDLDD